ncbi:hypothetical protein B0T17DRAFT_252945 [Bombardia bombarda]|uniref:F-box domain-containing protein n=1 Tax=Bombardia bombarda TaxID=252184 RepID=A0AA39X044_9PEZI|nr:hypothetical protein B0T17DRAFT_252945 [Bombardia bombarda]
MPPRYTVSIPEAIWDTHPDLPDRTVYTKQRILDNNLDNAHLVTRCRLDNGQFNASSIPARYTAGQLDELPAEILIQVLQYTDIPSLTRFRRVSRRAMDLVDSVPQYRALIKHCPDIIRAIISLQADAYDLNTLYATLHTSRCDGCKRFGDHLYLVTCCRVCFFCYTQRLEYYPLTINRASSYYRKPGERDVKTSHQLLLAENFPSVLSLPGRYCTSFGYAGDGGFRAVKRYQLFDRRAVFPDITSHGVPNPDKMTKEPRRFMCIITAPFLVDNGRQADWGYFCLGCEEKEEEKTQHYRIKYTREEMYEHTMKYGLVEAKPMLPRRWVHVPFKERKRPSFYQFEDA